MTHQDYYCYYHNDNNTHMDSSHISAMLMKLLEGIGMNEQPDKIKSKAASLIMVVENACKQVDDLDYVRAFRSQHQRKASMTESELQLQEQVDLLYAKFNEIIKSSI